VNLVNLNQTFLKYNQKCMWPKQLGIWKKK